MSKQIKKVLWSLFILALMAPALVSADEDKGREFLRSMDANGDGQITAAEHEEFAAKRFQMLDANGDGVATKDEMKALKKKMKKERMDKRSKRNNKKDDMERTRDTDK